MASAGYGYLAEVAAGSRTTSYSEFCAQVFDRTGHRVEPADAALGGLLAEIARRSLSDRTVLLPAVILSGDRGQPGAGFFTFAEDAGLLSTRARQDAKLVFWAEHLNRTFAAYGGR